MRASKDEFLRWCAREIDYRVQYVDHHGEGKLVLVDIERDSTGLLKPLDGRHREPQHVRLAVEIDGGKADNIFHLNPLPFSSSDCATRSSERSRISRQRA
jgi:hypothetical protein